MGVLAGVRLRARRGRIDIGAGVARSERLIAQGRPEEGESALRELLTACETKLRPDDRRWVSVRLALGTAQLALNRPQEALPIVTTALAEAERHRGTQFAVIPPLRSLVVLVSVLAGRHAEAADAAKRMEQAYGGGRDLEVLLPRYHLRGRWLQNLVLYCTGRFREGLDAGSALLPDMIAALGADHTDVSQHRLLRSAHLAALGRAGEALAECETVIATEARLAAAGRPDPGDRYDAYEQLACCLLEAGRPQEAEEAVRRVLAEAEDLKGPYSHHAGVLRRALAAALIAQGRYEAALPLLDGPAVWGCYDAGRHQMLLSEALHGLGRTGRAEAAANEALQAATVLFAPGHPRVLQIRTLLARIRASPAEMRTVAADWASHLGPDHPGTRAAREAC